MDDNSIISALWERSEKALSEINTRFYKLCMGIILNITGNKSDAEECFNSVLLAVWNSIPPERPQSLTAYICRISRNTALRKFRYNTAGKRKGTQSLEELYDSIADGDFDIEAATEDNSETDLKEALNTFLGTLDEKNRTLFIRRYVFEDDSKTLAKMTGLNERSINQRMYIIRIKLKEYLVKEGIINETH